MDTKERAFDYAIRITELVKFLKEEGSNYPLGDKLLSCGVSVGISLSAENPEERDYETAKKNVRETGYIIEMAAVAGYLSQKQTVYIREDARRLPKQIGKEYKR